MFLPRCSAADCFNSRSRMGSDWPSSASPATSPPFQFTLPHGERHERDARGGTRYTVSIHAPAWGATRTHSPSPSRMTFQFTLPHGERLGSYVRFSALKEFQFTLPHGERPWALLEPVKLSAFQFTLPHGERLGTPGRAGCAQQGFNSRSRMGSDCSNSSRPSLLTCFNSRSRMGSDCSNSSRPSLLTCFNSRSRMGSDRTAAVPKKVTRKFQFTLPHGERPRTVRRKVGVVMFQFTLPHGERPASCSSPVRRWAFQFTLPHGERRGRASPLQAVAGFNSRSRMGSDLRAVCEVTAKQWVSIHAPAWGATVYDADLVELTQVSIHAPAWGATRHPGHGRAAQGRFNSRSRMGSDIHEAKITFALAGFNSRSRMGSDKPKTKTKPKAKVSIHAPAWGATWQRLKRLR